MNDACDKGREKFLQGELSWNTHDIAAYREALLTVFPVACNAFQVLREGHVHRCGGVNCAGVLHECYVCGEFFGVGVSLSDKSDS